MPEKLSTRMDRVERLIGALAEKQTKLDDVVTLLVEAQIKTEERFRETDKRFKETDRRFREVARRFEQADQRMDRLGTEDKRLAKLAAEEKDRGRKLDERIDKLVSAIGEMLRTRNGGTH